MTNNNIAWIPRLKTCVLKTHNLSHGWSWTKPNNSQTLKWTNKNLSSKSQVCIVFVLIFDWVNENDLFGVLKEMYNIYFDYQYIININFVKLRVYVLHKMVNQRAVEL